MPAHHSPSSSPPPRRTRRPRAAAAAATRAHIDWAGGAAERRRLRAKIDGLARRLAAIDEDQRRAATSDAERHRQRVAAVDEALGTYERCMQAVRDSLLAQNRLLVDVPGDGSCGIHSVLPAFSASLGRPTSTQEVRELVVNELRGDAFRDELERDLRATNAVRRAAGEPPLASTDALLAELAEPDQFVPPELLYRATESFTRGRVRLWAYDSDRGAIPFLWTDGDDDSAPFACELVHVPAARASSRSRFVPRDELVSGHIARVLPLPSPERARSNFSRALERLNEDAARNKRMRLELAAAMSD